MRYLKVPEDVEVYKMKTINTRMLHAQQVDERRRVQKLVRQR